MAVTFATGSVIPTGSETSVCTITGGPFDKTSVYVQGGVGGQGQLQYRLYATVGGFLTLVAQSKVLGSNVASLLEWQDVATGSTTSIIVNAAGTDYTLTVQDLTPGQARGGVTATLASVNTFDTASDANAGSLLTVGPGAEGFLASFAGYAQLIDVALDQRILPLVLVTVYANCGGGSVQAAVAKVSLSGQDRTISAVFQDLVLPPATTYLVSLTNQSQAFVSLVLTGATHSVAATSGGAIILGGDVIGPSSANTDVKWRNIPLDAATMSAPADAQFPVFDSGVPAWRAVTMHGDATMDNTGNVTVTSAPPNPEAMLGIIYQPGGVSSGDTVATWPEVQTAVVASHGKINIYIDDSITSPAPVPTSTGITDLFGRAVIRAADPDSENIPVLEVESGATLRNLAFIVGVETQSNNTGATPSFDYTTPNGGNLSISEFGAISNAVTSTSAGIVIPAGQTFFLHLDTGDVILNAPSVPLFSVPATAELTPYLFNGAVLPANYASGAGNVFINYDNASAKFFSVADVPSPLPAITGFYQAVNLDAVLPNPGPQAQATWFIDPQNVTGLANDDNSGIDVTHPVLSYNNGVARKWTTYSPSIRQNTTLTWLSPHTDDTDPVVLTPIVANSFILIQGQLGAAQLLGSGVLAGVVSKDRATAQILTANLGASFPVGSLIQNTTAGKASFAWVYKNTAGTTYEISQPLSPTTPPFGPAGAAVLTEIDTWSNGDTFEVYAPMNINIVNVDPTIAEYFPGTASDFPASMQLYHMNLWSSNGAGFSDVFIGSDTTILECSADAAVIDRSQADEEDTYLVNCHIGQGATSSSSNSSFIQFYGGVLTGPFLTVFVSWSFDFDVILSPVGGGNIQLVSAAPNIFGNGENASFPFLGRVCLDGSVTGLYGTWNLTDVGGASIIWGSGALDIEGQSRVFYTAPAASVFLITTITLNKQTSAVAFDSSTGLWTTLIPITIANLDTTIVGGGFGGTAINALGGATLTSQATV